MVDGVVAVYYGAAARVWAKGGDAREEKRGGQRVGKKKEREERIKAFRLFYFYRNDYMLLVFIVPAILDS
jgi:hypothetical protein